MTTKKSIFSFVLFLFFQQNNIIAQDPEYYRNLASENKTHAIRKIPTGIKSSNSDTLIIDIFHDSSYNLYLALKDKKGFLIDVKGQCCSNVDTNKLIKCHLYNDSSFQYVVVAWFMGIPHNGPSYYVIWGNYLNTTDYWSWHITFIQLNNPNLEDRHQDGIYEIVEYYNSKNKDGDVYRFDKGKLIPVE